MMLRVDKTSDNNSFIVMLKHFDCYSPYINSILKLKINTVFVIFLMLSSKGINKKIYIFNNLNKKEEITKMKSLLQR